MRILRLRDGLLEAQLAFGELRRRDEEAFEIYIAAIQDGFDLVEVEIAGASFRQAAYASVAGPKDPVGKNLSVGVSLRYEPHNPTTPTPSSSRPWATNSLTFADETPYSSDLSCGSTAAASSKVAA